MQTINKKIKSLIEKNPMAFATVDKYPNVIGVAYAKVVSPRQILITDNYMKKTIENMKKNKKVGLAVWNSKWKGYKLIGTAAYYKKGKWKKFAEEMKENKGLPAKGAIIVSVKKIKKLC